MPSRAELEQQCLVILDRFMEALNAYDVTGMEAAMHFPHVRIANGKVVVYPEPGHNPLDLFQHLQAEDGWQYSAWNARENRAI